MERGIIASPAKYIGKGDMLSFDRALTSQDLRYFLLYWDRIVIPTTNLAHLALPEENEFLSTGKITRPRVPFSGSFNGEAMAHAQIHAQSTIANDLIKLNEIDWTLHQVGDGIILPDTTVLERQAVKVSLINTLPAPGEQVAIPDILEFKERRKDELISLRSALDDFYLEILSSPDQSLKTKIATSQLQKSIENLDRVSKERWTSVNKFTLSSALNISGKDIMAGVVSGAIIDAVNGFTIPIGTVLGGLLPLISIKAETAKTIEASKDKQILSYLSNAQKENLLE